MNRPSHEDDGWDHPDWNQNPPALAGDLTTRNDLNGIVNSRRNRDRRIDDDDLNRIHPEPYELAEVNEKGKTLPRVTEDPYPGPSGHQPERSSSSSSTSRSAEMPVSGGRHLGNRIMYVLAKYAKFVGPGVMISVAYIDPGNYSTAVAAGSTFRFRLLFIVFLSNIFAVYLQCLCVKLGSVTGLNLAEMIRAHCPRWLNWILYLFGEAAIICTDIAEVIGTAIALNLLFHIPLVAGCAISIVDVLVILLFYKPSGTVRGVRIFEGFVALLVIGVVVCFCYQLSLITNTSVGDVFRGYLPSSAIVKSKGLYQSCGILGATVMPHSLYLGSGIVQPRLKEYDVQHNNIPAASADDDSGPIKYRPSVAAVRSCMKYSIVELSTSLFIFALFVNSAILIVAGASLYNTDAASADLFGIHKLLAHQLAPVAGTIFALALLLSGISAGIVCTIAGQMICEGQLTWAVKPWVRRLMTRSISITPSIIIAGAVGADGLSAALDGSQVALSVILPFVSAPLIYFTCRERYMTMSASNGDLISMRNHWLTAIIAVIIWLVIVVMNVALLVLLGLGVD